MTRLIQANKQVTEDIRSYGWHVVKVLGELEEPPFGYSVGLYQTFGHPEIIIVGLELDLIHSLIDSIGESVRDGLIYKPGAFSSDILEGYDCYFLSVFDRFYDSYLGRAQVHYGSNNFPIWQCIYPTVKGIFPWDKKWPTKLKRLQPLLGDPPDSKSRA